MTQSTKSGLSNDGAVRLNVSSEKCHVGDHSCPQQLAQLTPVRGETEASRLRVEVPLVARMLSTGDGITLSASQHSHF